MPMEIVRQDITKMQVDAIVNPTNLYMDPGGGTDLAVHQAAGPQMTARCRELGVCPVGSVRVTPGFALPCRYVIHTAGPDWYQDDCADALLASCYRESLHQAVNLGCRSIAFPLIAAGTNGFPRRVALEIATQMIEEFLQHQDMTVYLVVFDKQAYEMSAELFRDVRAYIDDYYVEGCERQEEANYHRLMRSEMSPAPIAPPVCSAPDRKLSKSMFAAEETDAMDLASMLQQMDKSFSPTLLDYIDAAGISDVEAYKRSNVDKKTFSKIRCNEQYRPSKVTAVSFAIGLKLSYDQATHLLSTAGMCLSHANKFDVIIEYFLKSGNYLDIFEVNEVLYQFDQPLLGV